MARFSLREAVERVQALEERHDLLKYQVGGWSIWPILRFRTCEAALELKSDRGEHFSRREITQIALRDLAGLMRRRAARWVVKTYSSAHTDIREGTRRDVYFEDLMSQLGPYYKIEGLNNRSFFDSNVPYARARDISNFGIELLARRLALPPSRAALKAADAIARAVRTELDLRSFTAAAVAREFAMFEAMRRAHKIVLWRVRPSHLLVADGGEYASIAAARELGIKTVELQHGFADRHSLASSWTRYALKYKRKIPIADSVFLYGDHWRDELLHNGFWGAELLSVGSARVDRYRSIQSARPPEFTILLTTQGIDTEPVISFVSEFTRLAAERLKFRLVVKLHPAYPTNAAAYADAFRDDDRVTLLDGPAKESTFDLLSRSHLHLSIFSTCHFEALALGVPTVVLPFWGHELMQPIVDRGHATAVATPQELLDVALRCRTVGVAKSVADWYFKPNALENMRRALEG